jgi:hypothetical protein
MTASSNSTASGLTHHRGDLSVAFKPEGDGTYKVGIIVRRVKLKADDLGLCHRMIDLETTLRQLVDCDGMVLNPKLVLKLYCQVPKNCRSRVLRQREVDQIRLRSPRLRL